jgi:hypothetical protein
MTDLDRVLESLLHDLRSPLGVAGGYLRLMREQRLSSADETERAIMKTQDALRTMTTLCGEASEWLKDDPPGPPAAVPVEALVAQVAAEAGRMHVAVEVEGTIQGTTLLALESDRVARAVAALLAVVSRDTSARLTLRVESGLLRIAAVAPQRRAPEAAGDFDPWAYPGLSAALACRTIAQAGGRCLRGPELTDVLRVEFDVVDAPAGGAASSD